MSGPTSDLAVSAMLDIPAPGGVLVSFDPNTREWLVLRSHMDGDMPGFVVLAAHTVRAVAERRAGLHAAPVQAWLLYDWARGWKANAGWSTDFACARRFASLAEAELRLAADIDLLVLREDGRVTCPDLAS